MKNKSVTQITHAEARRLIQSSTDHVLDRIKRSLLTAHLEECRECNIYASEIKKLENELRLAMQRRWNLSPTPLPIHKIVSSVQNKQMRLLSNAMVTRTAAIALAILVIVFGTWQFSRTHRTSSSMLTFALPVPTPSTYLTSTGNLFQGCNIILYQVKESDTLESVALQYTVSKADIIQLNQMKSETLHPSTQIRIPLCTSTATGTVNTPTGTITITPQIETHTSTPG